LWARLIGTGDPAELADRASQLPEQLAGDRTALPLLDFDSVELYVDPVGERAAHPLRGIPWRQLGQPAVRGLPVSSLACTTS
jgi:hypothetical protein